MSRPLRIQYEGAWYRVMNRGAARKNIFFVNSHRELFLKILDQISQKFKIEIHAYCLMSNHYHLLVRTPLCNLSKAMRHLNGLYTQILNRDRKSDGALFRGRYKAILVEDEDYLIKLSRYIHLNPVQAEICIKPEEYEWSSYRFYVTKQKPPPWLHYKNILNRFGKCNQLLCYKEFTREGIDDETRQFYEKKKTFPILGSDNFISKVNERFLNNTFSETEMPDHREIKKLFVPNVNQVISAVACHYKVDESRIKTARRGQTNNMKSIAIYVAVSTCHVPLTAIAYAFGDSTRNGIANNYKRFSSRLEKDRFLQVDVDKVMRLIYNEEQGST